MNRSCPTTVRQRAEKTARELRRVDGCLGVDVLDPTQGKRPKWTLEATFECEFVPAEAVQVLGQNGCSLGPTGSRAPGLFHVIGLV